MHLIKKKNMVIYGRIPDVQAALQKKSLAKPLNVRQKLSHCVVENHVG